MVKVMLFEENKIHGMILKKDLESVGIEATLYNDKCACCDAIEKVIPDIVMVDVSGISKDGFEIVEELRMKGHNVPVIFMSSNNSIDDVIYGLQIGGGDFLIKPFDPRELIARIDLILSYRGKTRQQNNVLVSKKINDVVFDFTSNSLQQGMKVCAMTPTQSLIVKYLLEKKNQIVSFDNIIDTCKKNNRLLNYSMNGLKVTMSKLRKNISECGITNIKIETYRRKGFCLHI